MSIFQTDLLLRSALIHAMKDLRSKQWALDDIFSQAVQDSLLSTEFGYKEIKKVRNWFEKTDIPIIMQHRLDKSINMPCISISLVNSSEDQSRALMGDGGFPEDLPGDDGIIIEPGEIQSQPITILGPFDPKTYDSTTGIVVLPDGLTTEDVFAGQFLVDTQNNTSHPILKCLDGSSFQIASGVTADFTNAIIIPQFQGLKVERKRSWFRETYQIGIHASGDPEEAIWLHSIVVYILLRYKKIFFEGRGLELTTFTSSDFIRHQAYEPQNIYSRYVTLNAVVEQNWIEAAERKIEGIHIDSLKIIDGGVTPPAFQDEVDVQGWKMEDDED